MDGEAFTRPVRVAAMFIGYAAALAMFLTAIGLYGALAFAVSRRTKEIGIRVALGARPGTVVGLVMRQGLLVAAAGLIVGCVATAVVALVGARLITGVLYHVSVSDPFSWVGAATVLLAVSALANLIPAWRASRVDPSEALRIE